MASTLELIFQIAILIMSVVLHEVSHGYMAYAYGDPTAKYQGRLTLNPLKHLDPIGSIVVPLVAYFLGGFIFGWAKPVPYNPYNLRPGRLPEVMVALAGPLVNIFIAVVFGILLRMAIAGGYASTAFIHITGLVVFINILLAVFNLVPIPPLDGSKLLIALFPEKLYQLRVFFERYGLVLVLLFIFFIWQFVSPLITVIFHAITGVSI